MNLSFKHINSKSILIFLILVGFLCFIIGISQLNIINTYSIILVTITTISVYVYINRIYKSKLKRYKAGVRNKNKIRNYCNNNIDDKCKKYRRSNRKTYRLSRELLKKIK